MTCLLSFEDTLSLRHSGTSLSFSESSFHLSWSRSMAGTSISSPVSSPQFCAEVRALVSSSMLDVSSECLLCVQHHSGLGVLNQSTCGKYRTVTAWVLAFLSDRKLGHWRAHP